MTHKLRVSVQMMPISRRKGAASLPRLIVSCKGLGCGFSEIAPDSMTVDSLAIAQMNHNEKDK